VANGETDILRSILLCVGGVAKLFRNNVGSLPTPSGSRVTYGVGGPGGSDLIGWRSKIVTSDMVGKPVAIFCAIEVKDQKGKPSHEQSHFLSAVRIAGGISGIARSPKEALNLLDNH
jgi:hypothetical protein